MKKVFVFTLVVLLSACVQAQTFAEWFRQSATQKKYLLQQIAALQVYTGHVQKGYSIAKQGLNAIGDIKGGEFNLHKDYFNSLMTVNPEIQKYGKVADIAQLQVKIIKTCKEAIKQVKQSGSFNVREINYIVGVFERLLEDCKKTIDALITVTTSNQLEMKDDERLRRIDALYAGMQEKSTFVQAFSNEAKLLAASRIREEADIQTIRALNGIKN